MRDFVRSAPKHDFFQTATCIRGQETESPRASCPVCVWRNRGSVIRSLDAGVGTARLHELVSSHSGLGTCCPRPWFLDRPSAALRAAACPSIRTSQVTSNASQFTRLLRVTDPRSLIQAATPIARNTGVARAPCSILIVPSKPPKCALGRTIANSSKYLRINPGAPLSEVL